MLFSIELFDTVVIDRNNIVIDIDQMVDGRCIICLQVLSNVVACVCAHGILLRHETIHIMLWNLVWLQNSNKSSV
jgi:hypothetical protein